MKIYFLRPNFDLTLIKKPQDGKQRIQVDRKMTIGRNGPKVDIQLYAPTVSKEHVIVEPTQEGLLAKNICGRSNVKLNGVFSDEALLDNGSTLEILSFPFTVEALSEEELTSARAETIFPG